MVNTYNNELNKLGLEFVVIKEYDDKFTGLILECGVVILNKWSLLKCFQLNKIKEYAELTKINVENHKRLLKMII